MSMDEPETKRRRVTGLESQESKSYYLEEGKLSNKTEIINDGNSTSKGSGSKATDSELEDGELPDTESESEDIQTTISDTGRLQTHCLIDKSLPSDSLKEDRAYSPTKEVSSTLSLSDIADSSQLETTVGSQSSDSTPQVTPVKCNKEDIPETEHNGLTASTSGSGLQELEIIDDYDVNEDGEADQREKTGNYSESSEEEYLNDDEIYSMLEQGIDKKSSQANKDAAEDKNNLFVEREKLILKEYGTNPFEVLPEGWLQITHNSGMPIYLHKASRVCTMSKPYFLGAGSVRRHDLPVSAIPCLHYRRAKEKALAKKEENERKATDPETISEEKNDECSITADNGPEPKESDGTMPAPTAKIQVEQLENHNASISLSDFRDYCEKIFEFDTFQFKKFRRWKDRRIYMRKQNRPTLPASTKLLTCPTPPTVEKNTDKGSKKKEFVLNPVGKSLICILHEYVQHSLRIQPVYQFEETGNAEKPYSATILMSGIKYGTGFAASKKNAKLEAAKETMRILMPEMTKMMVEELDQDMQDLSFFDEVRVEDPRVNELCQKAGQPRPYQILLECLKRNYGMGDTTCHESMKVLRNQKNEFTMSVGTHKATVICKNKREGKHQAAQAILQLLHPHIKNWGSLLRMYGPSFKSELNNSEEEAVTELQGEPNKPNYAVLNKLKEEMTKLREKKNAIVSKGKVTVSTSDLPVQRTDTTHPSVRIKGTENNYNPTQCFEPLCLTKNPHMHCPFCVRTDMYQDPVILKAHYRVKHVDKGIDFAGLKVLRCCDHCDIVGIIKGEKKFKGAHWHCYRCKNGFNRRDEALKHYKTHFRNPHTTFQIQVTQEVHRASNESSPSEVNSATQNIPATNEVTIHPSLSPAVTSLDGQELLNQVEKARLPNGKPSDGIVHVSVAANETIETVTEDGQTITIIQDNHLEGSEDGTYTAQIISNEGLMNQHDTITRKYDELVEKYHNLETEKYRVDQEVEKLKQKNQQLKEALKVLQKNQQKLIEQFSVPLNSSLQDILDEMTNQHKNLLQNHLSLLKQTYVAELVSQSSVETNIERDENEQVILSDSKEKSDSEMMSCVISADDISEISTNNCSNSHDSSSLTDSLGDQIVHVIVSGPPNGEDCQMAEGGKYVIQVKENDDSNLEQGEDNIHIQSSSGETYIISNSTGHPSLNHVTGPAIFTEASTEVQNEKMENGSNSEDGIMKITTNEEVKEPPVKKLKS